MLRNPGFSDARFYLGCGGGLFYIIRRHKSRNELDSLLFGIGCVWALQHQAALRCVNHRLMQYRHPFSWNIRFESCA